MRHGDGDTVINYNDTYNLGVANFTIYANYVCCTQNPGLLGQGDGQDTIEHATINTDNYGVTCAAVP